MISFTTACIVASFVAGILVIVKIRRYDVFEREPFLALVNSMLLGGAGAWLLAAGGYQVLRTFGVTHLNNVAGAFLVIGPVEELAKLAAFLVIYRLYAREIDEPTDGILYMSAVALGFSLIENFLYANAGLGNGRLLFYRTFVATPAHVLASCWSGLAPVLCIKYRFPVRLAVGTALATIAIHGLYDSLVMSKGAYLALLLLLVLYNILVNVLTYTNLVSPFKKGLRQAVREYESTETVMGFCVCCGKENSLQEYRIADFNFAKCLFCGKYGISRDNIFRLFHHFAPDFGRIGSRYNRSEDKPGFFSLYSGNYIDDARKRGYFDLDELSAVIEKLNADKKARLKKKFPIDVIFRDRLIENPPADAAGPANQWAFDAVILPVGILITVGIMLGLVKSRRFDYRASTEFRLIDNRYFSFEYPVSMGVPKHSSYADKSVQVDVKYKDFYFLGIRACKDEMNLDSFVVAAPAPRDAESFLRTDTVQSWGSIGGLGIVRTYLYSGDETVAIARFYHKDSLFTFRLAEVMGSKYAGYLVNDLKRMRMSFRLHSAAIRPDTTSLLLGTLRARRMFIGK
jgi:RsiW-degrading membrane proteinase PrsW (M82 family)